MGDLGPSGMRIMPLHMDFASHASQVSSTIRRICTQTKHTHYLNAGQGSYHNDARLPSLCWGKRSFAGALNLWFKHLEPNRGVHPDGYFLRIPIHPAVKTGSSPVSSRSSAAPSLDTGRLWKHVPSHDPSLCVTPPSLRRLLAS